MSILQSRVILKGQQQVQQHLIQGLDETQATWEDHAALIEAYPNLNLEDKVVFNGGGIVTNTNEDNEYIVEELTPESFSGVDIALFSAGGSISKEFGPIAVVRGTIVVDNSSAFRMDEKLPLVIPEVNPEALANIKVGMGKGALIANPIAPPLFA